MELESNGRLWCRDITSWLAIKYIIICKQKEKEKRLIIHEIKPIEFCILLTQIFELINNSSIIILFVKTWVAYLTLILLFFHNLFRWDCQSAFIYSCNDKRYISNSCTQVQVADWSLFTDTYDMNMKWIVHIGHGDITCGNSFHSFHITDKVHSYQLVTQA